MSKVSLAQFLSTIQDNLQRSYDYAEDLANLNRRTGDLGVTLALSDFEIEIPISGEISEQKINPRDLATAGIGASPFTLAELRLQTPTSVSNLRGVLAGQMIQSFEKSRVKSAEPQEVGLEKPIQPTQKSDQSTKRGSQNQVAQPIPNKMAEVERINVSLGDSEATVFDLWVNVLSDDVGAKPTGKITARFKTTLK